MIEPEQDGPSFISRVCSQLNEIAEQQSAGNQQLDADDWSEVSGTANFLHALASERIERLVAATELSTREAIVWTFRDQYADETRQLSTRAIALCVSSLAEQGLMEGQQADQSRPPSKWVTPDEIEDILASVHEKYQRSEALIELYRTDAQDLNGDPSIHRLGRETIIRLERQMQADDAHYDEVLNRILDGVEERRTLEDFLTDVLAERGRENIDQIAVHGRQPERLKFSVHVNDEATFPRVARETDALDAMNRRFEFSYYESLEEPDKGDSVTLYRTSNDPESVDVPLQEGLVELRNRLSESLSFESGSATA